MTEFASVKRMSNCAGSVPLLSYQSSEKLELGIETSKQGSWITIAELSEQFAAWLRKRMDIGYYYCSPLISIQSDSEHIMYDRSIYVITRSHVVTPTQIR